MLHFGFSVFLSAIYSPIPVLGYSWMGNLLRPNGHPCIVISKIMIMNRCSFQELSGRFETIFDDSRAALGMSNWDQSGVGPGPFWTSFCSSVVPVPRLESSS